MDIRYLVNYSSNANALRFAEEGMPSLSGSGWLVTTSDKGGTWYLIS